MPRSIGSASGVSRHIKEIKPLVIPGCSFFPKFDSNTWVATQNDIHVRQLAVALDCFAPITLPTGATMRSLTMYAFRDDALATLVLTVYRNDRANASVIVGAVTADWVGGWDSGIDDTLADNIIDNENYNYVAMAVITPNDDILDVRLAGLVIHWN